MMPNPIIIGAVLRVENVDECISEWTRHITLRSWSGTQFEMTIDESLDRSPVSRFRIGDYWSTVKIDSMEYGFGLLEVDEGSNAELRRKDAAMRALHEAHEVEWKRKEAAEVMDILQTSPHEMTFGDGAFAQPPEPPRQVFGPGVICSFTQGPFHPLRLLEKPESQPGYWVVVCLDHGHVGLVLEEHLRHATPEETANLARKGGDA